MDESIRRQLKRRKRERRWRYIRSIFVVVLVAGSLCELWRYVHDPNFAFGSIKIEGSRHLTQGEILKMSEQGLPVNIINLNTSKIEYALNHDARFLEGKCRYKWPGVLEVSVIERAPAIYIKDSYGSYIKIDYDGVVMSVTKGIPDYSAPILLNELLDNVFVGDTIKNQRILATLKFLGVITYDACKDFAEMKFDEYNNLHIFLKSGVRFVVDIFENVEVKGKAFRSIYDEIKNRFLDVEYVDLRFNKPYLRMRNGQIKK